MFPPDSIPSWITIFTGIEPGEHGILQSIDYLKKRYKNFKIDTNAFKGHTFWDIAGREGKKVCIVNPFMAYPAWPVNGVMISGPIFITGNHDAYPQDIFSKYPNIPPIGGITDIPTRKTLRRFINKTMNDTRQLAQYSLEFFSNEEWQLFFVSFFTLDRIQHFLWRFTDERDPTYPGITEYKNSILEFYKEYDDIVGEFTKSLKPDDTLMVLSDHGHGMRCTETLNLNEFLRKCGYLQLKTGKIPLLSKQYWVEKTKNLTLQFLFTLHIEELAYHIARAFPNPKVIKTSSHIINKDDSIAHLSDFAGMGSCGGISLNLDLKSTGAYEEVLQDITTKLNELNENHNNTLFKWIKTRQSVIGDQNNSIYPDILFELKSNLGVGWGLYVPLVARNPFHRRISGGHKMDGILASNKRALFDYSMSYHVKDVKSSILRALGLADSL